jgi:hypothetical protein
MSDCRHVIARRGTARQCDNQWSWPVRIERGRSEQTIGALLAINPDACVLNRTWTLAQRTNHRAITGNEHERGDQNASKAARGTSAQGSAGVPIVWLTRSWPVASIRNQRPGSRDVLISHGHWPLPLTSIRMTPSLALSRPLAMLTFYSPWLSYGPDKREEPADRAGSPTLLKGRISQSKSRWQRPGLRRSAPHLRQAPLPYAPGGR